MGACFLVLGVVLCLRGRSSGMDDETLETTALGITALKKADTNITPLELHVLFTCMGARNTMLDVMDSIQKHSKERKFIEPKYVAQAVQSLIKRELIKQHIPVIARPVNKRMKYTKENKYARR